MKHVLFVCSQNWLRSPTGENTFASWPGIEVISAGTNDAATPLTAELVQWADIIFVMEKMHRQKLSTRFREHLHGKRVVCLNIRDNYRFMDPELLKLLKAKVPKHLPPS
jgi:predicted protein tyrosine phosphatase